MSRFDKANQLNAKTKPKNDFIEVSIDKVYPNPDNARKEFSHEKLLELSQSILKYGLLQSIIVVKKDDKFMIVGGERRWRAIQLAELTTIKVHVIESDNISELNLIENLIRDDLTDYETAVAVVSIWESDKYKTKKELSESLCISNTVLSKYLNIIDNLDDTVQDSISGSKNTISTSVMLEVAKQPKEAQKSIIEDYSAGKIKRDDINKKLTVGKFKKTMTLDGIDSKDVSDFLSGLDINKKYKVTIVEI